MVWNIEHSAINGGLLAVMSGLMAPVCKTLNEEILAKANFGLSLRQVEFRLPAWRLPAMMPFWLWHARMKHLEYFQWLL